MAAASAALFRRPFRHAPAETPRFWPLTLGAVGVVYGDIGTSPIYAFREAAVAATGEAVVSQAVVLGILSLIVWSLLLLVTLKYVFVLLRADFNGEGGTFALMSLAQSVAQRQRHLILLFGIAGAAFLYGDAALTPALSVISAVEGLKVIAPQFEQLYGFMEAPDVVKGLELCRRKGLNIDPASTSFYLSRRTLRPTARSQMSRWEEKLFISLADSADDATTYFQLPPGRVVGIGTQIVV